MTATASVVIPAHDEEAVIGRCLDSLLEDADPGEFDVVVVCNGCGDATADVARGHAAVGVRTVEIATASKPAALNEGDRCAQVLPRVYVDADVVVSTDSLRLLLGALQAGALAAAPRARLDTAGCSIGVRAYAAVWSRLGHVSRGLGSGVYALSAQGRARFDAFPDIVADDFFVYCAVRGDERVCPPGAESRVRAPRTLRDLARRRIRIELGNAQVKALGLAADPPSPSLPQVVRARPWLAPAAGLYVGVHLWARRQVRRRSATGVGWQRDSASRADAAGSGSS